MKNLNILGKLFIFKIRYFFGRKEENIKYEKNWILKKLGFLRLFDSKELKIQRFHFHLKKLKFYYPIFQNIKVLLTNISKN